MNRAPADGPHPWIAEIAERFPCETIAVRYYRPPARRGGVSDLIIIPTKLRLVHNSLDITIGPVVESKHNGTARCLVSVRKPWQCESLSSLSEVAKWVSVNAQ